MRFELARKLVRAVTFLYASGWLHKNIRLESIVFFRKPNETDPEDRTATALDLERPPASSSSGPGSRPAPLLLNQHRWRINLDHYQHPTKHHYPPSCGTAPHFDVYSLGLVLLAIGL